MDPVSIFAIVGATAAVISSFRDGLDMFKAWRKKRKAARLAKVAQVEQSLERNPPEVEREYKQHVARLGRRFEKGDDISNKSLAKIIKKFTCTLITTLKELKDFNSGNLFDASENARRETLDVMFQLCQRLQTSAPIRNMKKAKDQTTAKESQLTCPDHSCNPSSPTLSVQVQVHACTGDDLSDVLNQIPKANPIITVSVPAVTVGRTVCTDPNLVSQMVYTSGSCRCGYNTTTPDAAIFHQNEKTDDLGSPLKKRLDEMDRDFSSILDSVVARPPSMRPTSPAPPPTKPFDSKQPDKDPLDTRGQSWHSWYSWSPAPSVISSTLPASTQTPSRSAFPGLVYSPQRTSSLQDKLNSMTRAMISAKPESLPTLLPSPLPSVRSGFSPVLRQMTLPLAQTPPPAANDRRDRIWQWAETVDTESIASGPKSVAGDSNIASFAFPGVRRYAGSVRMTGGLPTPPL